MAEHREQVDKRMMQRINRRVLTPLLIDLGARYLVKPYLGRYEDEAKTAHWGFGHKRHGDKRHRTTVVYAGITYTDGEKKEGKAYQRVEERYSAWSVKHDNRLGAKRRNRDQEGCVVRRNVQPNRNANIA